MSQASACMYGGEIEARASILTGTGRFVMFPGPGILHNKHEIGRR